MRPVQAAERQALDAEIVRRFQDAWNRHDVEQVMALVTEDCVFKSTWPPPDGQRAEGWLAMREFWGRFFEESPRATIEIEYPFACGDRVTMCWRSAGKPTQGMRITSAVSTCTGVRHDKVAEKLSYVKG